MIVLFWCVPVSTEQERLSQTLLEPVDTLAMPRCVRTHERKQQIPVDFPRPGCRLPPGRHDGLKQDVRCSLAIGRPSGERIIDIERDTDGELCCIELQW